MRRQTRHVHALFLCLASLISALELKCVDDSAMPPSADLIGRFQDQCDVQTSIYHDFRHDTGFGVNLKEYAKFCAREMGEGRRCDMRNNRMPWYLEGCGKPNALECFTRPVTACERGDADEEQGKAPGERMSDLLTTAHLHSSAGMSAALFQYFLRPDGGMAARIHGVVDKAYDAGLEPRRTISLMIRGSDKCLSEVTCFSFDEYMKVCNHIRALDPKVDTIIMTTEDPDYMDEWQAYAEGGEKAVEEGFHWNFVFNDNDVHQGGGGGKYTFTNMDVVEENPEHRNAIMESMLENLYLQLHGQYVIITCKSYFHEVLVGLIHAGCSHAMTPLVLCIEEQQALGIAGCLGENCRSILHPGRGRAARGLP